MAMIDVDDVLKFASLRHGIYLSRQAGMRPPWTDDDILQTYRFCNVYRELDKVTIWIAQNWREPNKRDPDLWFAMVVARFINWPDTLAAVGYPVPWDPERFRQRMGAIKGKRYTGAYMIRADPDNPGVPTYVYQDRMMFSPMWGRRETLRPQAEDTLNSYHMMLGQLFGLGSFMAAQVVADLKYVRPLSGAADWDSFAASGPGSRRGLNRVLGRRVEAPWQEEEWRLRLEDLRHEFNKGWRFSPLHAQDMQNVLCEFDKYERVRTHMGRPRAMYRYA